MKRVYIIALLSLFVFAGFSQEIPDIHKNLYQDEKGIFLEKDGEKIYALAPEDQFKFTDLYGNVSGNDKGLLFDFKNSGLNGTLYFGFINYNDAKYPQPVFFKKTAPIESGNAFINIADDLSGKYDMIGWQDSGQGTLGYRIVKENGHMLYDGKASFSWDGKTFQYLPTLIEGPFVDLLTNTSLVVSFETTEEVSASVLIDGKTYSDKEPTFHHEIEVRGLQADTHYDYTVEYGNQRLSFSFRTAPEKGSRKPFTFAYASDSRAGQGGGERDIFGTNAYIVKKIAALARAENAAFLQFTGDLINGYENSRERMQLQYTNWKHAIEPFAHYFPVNEGFGNHESYGYIFLDGAGSELCMIDHFPFQDDSGESMFMENFVNPTNGPFSEDDSKYDPNPDKMDFPPYEETVFWYQHDNVAMIVLNSNYWYAPDGHQLSGGNIHAFIMDQQMLWLAETLQMLEEDETVDHVFITLHTPFFPNGGHVKDDMWYNGNNDPRPIVEEYAYDVGIIQRRDQLLDLIVNKSDKPLALLTGDEHNYNLLPITNDMERYPEDYPHKKLELKRKFYQVNNGAAGAPYYAQEETPWMDRVQDFSTQNALVLFDIDGKEVKVRVKNPDTLEDVAEYNLR